MEDITVCVYLCPMCKLTCRNFAEWMSHLRLAHSNDPSFSVTCGINGCKMTYTKFSSFNTHVYRHHKTRINIHNSDDLEHSVGMEHLIEDQLDKENFQPTTHSTSAHEHSSPCVSTGSVQETGIPIISLKKASGLFLLNLKEGKGLSQTAVDSVVDGCESIVTRCLEQVQADIRDKLNNTDHCQIISEINEVFAGLEKPFDGLRTTYMQEKFYREHFNMAEPIEVNLGRKTFKMVGSGAKRRSIEVNEGTFYYIPIYDTLRQVLLREDIRQLLSFSRQNDGIYRDFCDGDVFKNHPLFVNNPSALQIIAYFDELEVCNPLGSASKIHKVGVFLFTIGNLPPKFRSSLKSVYLFAVAKASDIKKYTTDAILAPFVSDIKRLATEGISISARNGEDFHYKGTLLAFLGDNLASHGVGGFKESFSSTFRFCRTCLATHSQASNHFVSEDFVRRTPDEHKAHCDLLVGPLSSFNSTTYGINRRSCLEEIHGFSVVQNLPHDIMHDILEGVFILELPLLLKHCFTNNYFSCQELNERLSAFDVGYSEVANKPIPFELSAFSTVKIRLKASQMWLLVRILPLIIGHWIPKEDSHWECFCLLLQILNICTAQSINIDGIACLKSLIEEHHQMFKTLYPSASIIPKLHFIVHYVEQILLFGPLIRCWTMRHEAKLKFCKLVAKFGNFKNICLSITKKINDGCAFNYRAVCI